MFKTALNILLLILALFVFLAVWSSWGPWLLLFNTLVSLIALKLIGWLGIRIEISIWTILILLIAGLPGLLILIFLSVTGIAFRGK